MMQNIFKTSMLAGSLVILAACNGGGGGPTGCQYNCGPSMQAFQSPTMSVTAFVNALNAIGGAGQNQSYVELYTDETIRSIIPGQEDWFVIWDDRYNEYKAVSLQYVRSIIYYDYYATSTGTAREFRNIETRDILAGNVDGDYWGDDYEVVDYDYYTNTYVGRRSGFDYEDEAGTTDVSLMTADAQFKEFATKAASLSFAYSIPLKASGSLVAFGEKAEQLLSKSNNELTLADQNALAVDLQKLTGVTLSEVVAASKSEAAKDEVLGKIAKNLKTTSAKVENILEMVQIDL